MSPEAEQKKRPPPIQIPRLPPQRVIPGPNAFAIAAKARQDEVDKDEKRSKNSTPLTSPMEGLDPHPSRPDSKARKDGSSRAGSAITTFTQIIEAARGSSPRKSDGHSSSTTSRHGSTARSRHSNKSHRSAGSSHPSAAGADDEKTVRGQIEGKAEKKFFKMMGHVPGSPTTGDPGVQVVQAGRYGDTNKASASDDRKTEEVAKSPKKKLFGMSIPSFKSSANNGPPAPPMPTKAAQVFGTRPSTGTNASPSGQRRNTPRPLKQTVRSDTSKSLPSKLYNHHNHSRRQNHHGSPRLRNRTPNHKAQPSERLVQWQDAEPHDQPEGSSSERGVPPTPPQKDTPRDGMDRGDWAETELLQEKTHKESLESANDEAAPSLPTFLTTAKAVPSDGGQSPTKFCPYGAEEYAKLVQPQRIASVRAKVDGEVSELEGDSHYTSFDHESTDMQRMYPDWWEEQRQKRFTNAFNGQRLPALPPTFYSPSAFSINLFEGGRPSHNTDQQHLLFAIPSKPKPGSMRSDTNHASIDVIFQGTASEIDPTSETAMMINSAQRPALSPAKSNDAGLATRVMQELQSRDQAGALEHAGSGPQHLQPEQSSSKLTDMLSGISPSKSGYNSDFYANCPSALPSPLYGMPGQQMPPSTTVPAPISPPHSWPGTLADGSNILSHFYMCNAHMDVLGRTLYDVVADSKREAVKIASDKHEDTMRVLEEQFQDIKSSISSVDLVAERISEQNQIVNTKLDKLQDFIKADVVEPLAAQTKKQADMENSIKALQKVVQDLQKMIDSRLNSSTAAVQPLQPIHASFPPALPHNRSQPSLPGFFDPTNDSNRDGSSRMQPIQESRNDGRFRYGNNHHAQHWYRPATLGRESKDENHGFPNANPFLHSSPGQFGGGYLGYGGYYPGGPNEHSFSYSPGASK